MIPRGVASVVTLGADVIVSAAPSDRAGAAAALSESGAEIGGALGVAVLGSVGAAAHVCGSRRASCHRAKTKLKYAR
jgi:DHA2 family multidrug resistance protein-like MFS transporter